MRQVVLGFNPCFNGSIFQTEIARGMPMRAMRFNPCFNGSIFQTQEWKLLLWRSKYGVSILVLMEVSFRQQAERVRMVTVLFQSLF